jgi:hypothetical protein
VEWKVGDVVFLNANEDCPMVVDYVNRKNPDKVDSLDLMWLDTSYHVQHMKGQNPALFTRAEDLGKF